MREGSEEGHENRVRRGRIRIPCRTLKVAGNDVVVGKMGVWEAETSVDRDDVLKLLRLMIGNLSLWRFLLKLLPYAVFGRKRNQGSATSE